MRRVSRILCLVLCGFGGVSAADGIDTGAVIGGGVGGAVGAAVGSAVGGRTGAVVGGGLGAAAGVAIATHEGDDEPEPRTREVVYVDSPPEVIYVEPASMRGHPRHRQHPGLALGHRKHKHKFK